MKIRDKLFLGFGLYISLAVVLSFFGYKELRSIGTRLDLVETTDDITNTILEVRRYEKNFLLYRNRESYEGLQKYLDTLRKNIGAIQSEIINEIGSDDYAKLISAIAGYERLIKTVSDNFVSQEELEKLVQKQGRTVKRRLSGGPPRLARPEIKNYGFLFGKLFHLYEEEEQSIDKMRLTAREIESITKILSMRERADIAAMIRMSITLLVIALVLVVVVGIAINNKLANSITTPIRMLEKITMKIAQGDFSEHIEVKGHDELSSLEVSFNLMAEKLENALQSLDHWIEMLQMKQAQLVEAEKLASVGKLAAGVAHEINNPLTSVLTFSNLMLEQCPPSDPRHEKLKLMARETNRARNIVRQLLNFGREIVIKPEEININQPVSEIADSLEAQDAFKGIELVLKLGENLPAVQADPAQIGQVVMNMLLNAIHAISPPGRIEVATRLNRDAVEIVFSDTGQGIPEENIHKVFDPFFTTKDADKGTGLGLAVSYGIIKKHGGDIEVSSIVGQGTTFTVRLPIHG